MHYLTMAKLREWDGPVPYRLVRKIDKDDTDKGSRRERPHLVASARGDKKIKAACTSYFAKVAGL